MSAIRECAPFPFLTMLVLCLIAPLSFAGSPSYHHNVAVGQDGRPSLKLTNDADIPMVAFMMAEFPSLGMEGRTYFDYFTNERNLPIQPGASITRSLSYFPKSDVSKVRAAVRAAIFQDGSTAGDPVWVNAILARRLRLYDRIISLRNLLGQKGSSESSPEAVIAMLRAAQSEADKQLPEDDLRVIDDTMFYGAISTIENNRQASVEAVVERYLGYLELQAARLQRSRPSLDTIRGAPVTIPNPLTDESLPPDLQDARAAYASKVVPYAGGNLSSCTVLGAGFDDHQIPLAPCPGNSATDNQYPLFTNSFGFFNASTGKTTDVAWSWTPGPNDLDLAYGVCYQYYDCANNANVFYKQGFASGWGAAMITAITTVSQGQNARSFYWTFDYYPAPTFSSCGSCAPNPAGIVNPISVNAPKPGVTFYFSWDCSVTPR